LNRPAYRSDGSKLALNWRVLGLLNLYRVLVPLVLVSLYSLGGGRGLSVDSQGLFFAAAGFYLCFGLASVILVRRRLGSAYLQTILQATLDIVVLMLLLHACGGVASGLGLLLLVPIGSLAFLLPPRSALFLAAVTILALLAHTIWQQLTGRVDINIYATAGLLGLVLFTIAASASFVANSMQQSEDLVRQRDLDLANLAELSQYIVQHLRESLLVVDATDSIRGRGVSAAALLADHLASQRAQRGRARELRGRGRRAADPAAFCTLGRLGTRSDLDLPRGYQPHGRARAAEQAGRARPAVRQHRPRDSQSGWRHEPRRPAARRKRRHRRQRAAAHRHHP
jgi:hypothetical protein